MAKQAVIALSTGEAEYDGLISAASAALGEQAMMADWGIRLPVTVALWMLRRESAWVPEEG